MLVQLHKFPMQQLMINIPMQASHTEVLYAHHDSLLVKNQVACAYHVTATRNIIVIRKHGVHVQLICRKLTISSFSPLSKLNWGMM